MGMLYLLYPICLTNATDSLGKVSYGDGIETDGGVKDSVNLRATISDPPCCWMHESDKDDKDATLNSFLFDLWRLHFSISGRHLFELELCHPFGGGAGFILDLQQFWRSHYFTIGAGHGRKDCIGTQVTDGVFSMQVATQRRYWKQQKKSQEKKARAIKNEQRA